MQGYENTMYVTAGGHTNAYAPSYINYGYYIYEDGQWLNRDLNNPVVGSMIDFSNIFLNLARFKKRYLHGKQKPL